MRNKFFDYEGDPENKSTVLVKEHFLKWHCPLPHQCTLGHLM